jgi:hypothetical protein
MQIASLIDQYFNQYMSRHGDNAIPEQLRALRSIQHCKTDPAIKEWTLS